jgi:hypothetical protein
MSNTIAALAHRLSRLERRVKTVEWAQRQPQPIWHDLPLTGDTSIPDMEQLPQIRATLQDTLEFSGRIGLSDGRAADKTPIARLPEDYWPSTARTIPVASDARRPLHLDISPEGAVLLNVSAGGIVKATWISLDGSSCRSDSR